MLNIDDNTSSELCPPERTAMCKSLGGTPVAAEEAEEDADELEPNPAELDDDDETAVPATPVTLEYALLPSLFPASACLHTCNKSECHAIRVCADHDQGELINYNRNQSDHPKAMQLPDAHRM